MHLKLMALLVSASIGVAGSLAVITSGLIAPPPQASQPMDSNEAPAFEASAMQALEAGGAVPAHESSTSDDLAVAEKPRESTRATNSDPPRTHDDIRAPAAADERGISATIDRRIETHENSLKQMESLNNLPTIAAPQASSGTPAAAPPTTLSAAPILAVAPPVAPPPVAANLGTPPSAPPVGWPQQPPVHASWQPLMTMQISQLGEALRQIDEHARQQQKSIDQVMGEIAEMARDRERREIRQLAQQSAQQPAPPAAEPTGAGQTPRIQLDPEGDSALNINVQDAEIRDVLDLLSQQIERNIVPLPSVTGKVTAFLTGVSVDEALDAILKSKGYVARREQKFIYIGTKADFKDEDEEQMRTRVYRPNYISAQELQQLITPLLTIGVGQASVGQNGADQAAPAAGGSLGALSALGALGALGAPGAGGAAGAGAAGAGAGAMRIASTSPTASGLVSGSTETGGLDYAGNDAVLVKDFEHVLTQIDDVVSQLDRRPRQVSIEAMILTVRLDDNLRLGVNFEALQNKSDVRIASGSPLSDLANLAPTPGSLKFGYLGSSLSSFIEALENVGETDIVASPRLLCLNKQQAEILIGSELGFVNTTVTQTAATQAVEFLEVGTQLRFRPFITDDNVIRLELHPELSTGTVRIEEGLTLPDKEVTKVTTNILCRDGATVIIGGLIREDLTTSVSQLPVLGSVPYVGAAFRRKTQAVDRREIIVLITPRVVTEEDSHCEGVQAQQEFMERQEIYYDKMSPLAKRQIGQRYLRQGRSAWNAGDVKNAFRYCNLALHYHPNHLDVLRLRQEIVEAHPNLDLPLRDRFREGLGPGQRPLVNYPRKGVPWQAPAPIVGPEMIEHDIPLQELPETIPYPGQ